jgi:hypothetical protein
MPKSEKPAPRRWPVWKQALVFYPFVTAAMTISLFLLGLVGKAVGFAGLSANSALIWSIPISVPLSWLAARWVNTLMNDNN